MVEQQKNIGENMDNTDETVDESARIPTPAPLIHVAGDNSSRHQPLWGAAVLLAMMEPKAQMMAAD